MHFSAYLNLYHLVRSERHAKTTRVTHKSDAVLSSTHLPTASACHFKIFSPTSTLNLPSASVRGGDPSPTTPFSFSFSFSFACSDAEGDAFAPAPRSRPLMFRNAAAAVDEVEEVVGVVALFVN